MTPLNFARMSRKGMALALLGLLGLSAGCGGSDPNVAAPAPATTPDQNESERAAREKAFGKGKSIEEGKPSKL